MSHASPLQKHAGRWLPALLTTFSGLLLGCTGSIGEVDDTGAAPPDAEISCTEGPVAARTPLRRLTRAEYRATIRDLLDVPAPELVDFASDESRDGFNLNVSAPSLLSIEKLRAAAETFATTAREKLEDTCDVAETDCARELLTDFGLRAFRRPLDAGEIDEYVALYEAERDAADGATALELALQTMLMSPHFLYHVEIGRGAVDERGIAKLDGYEVAARLSYFFWGTLPDDVLFGEAASGALDAPEGIEAAARRMLVDPRASEMLREFARQWLQLDAVDGVVRDATVFPDWSPDLVQSMRTETETFLDQVILHGDGKVETLLTAPYSYLDAPLAEHYGVDAEGDFEKTALPGSERAGLLTQGLLLVTHAHPAENSWVHRGKFVRERMLCAPLPPVPATVTDFTNKNDPNRLSNPECSGCHVMMDPIGKAFDVYDPTGRFDTLDATGAPIDPAGEVVGSDIGTFESIVELASDLAADPVVHACFADTWATYALGRSLDEDPCTGASILEAFDASGHDLRELFVAIAKSDAFRFTKAD